MTVVSSNKNVENEMNAAGYTVSIPMVVYLSYLSIYSIAIYFLDGGHYYIWFTVIRMPFVYLAFSPLFLTKSFQNINF